MCYALMCFHLCNIMCLMFPFTWYYTFDSFIYGTWYHSHIYIHELISSKKRRDFMINEIFEEVLLWVFKDGLADSWVWETSRANFCDHEMGFPHVRSLWVGTLSQCPRSQSHRLLVRGKDYEMEFLHMIRAREWSVLTMLDMPKWRLTTVYSGFNKPRVFKIEKRWQSKDNYIFENK